MPEEKYDKSPVDYVLLILTPALIMTLVGSLVFFLIEVLYAGEFKDRLRMAFFWYVFGAVLVARISMMADIAARAPIYGLILAVLAYVVLHVYIKYDPESRVQAFGWAINFVLIGIVWWSTHRLTWDCTRVEDDTEAEAGEGLLEAAGLEARTTRVEDIKIDDLAKAHDAKGLVGWWERYQRYRELKKNKRKLGVWVVYFALATLPIFGLGQALLAGDDDDRRQNTFWLMAIYVASGLGLLLTTCFLSLRRYLRQRNVEMPVKMTVTWLATGAGVILVLLLVGALLPRPKPEYSLLDLNPLRAQQRNANKFSAFKNDAGKGEGQQGGSSRDNKDGGEGKDSGNKDGKNSGSGKDKSSNSGDKGEKDKGGDKGKKDSKDGKDSKDSKDAKSEKDSGGDSNSKNDQSSKNDSPQNNDPQSSSSNPISKVLEWLGPLGQILKWIVFAIVALIVLFAVFRHGLKFLANFSQWARDLLESLRKFWERWFGSPAREKATAAAVEEQGASEPEPQPFASFRNPFQDGTAEDRSLKDLLRYTFAALEAWARERHLTRLRHETPLEFGARIVTETPGLGAELQRFIALYIRSEYARGNLPANVLEAVRQFWDRLEAVAEQPLST